MDKPVAFNLWRRLLTLGLCLSLSIQKLRIVTDVKYPIKIGGFHKNKTPVHLKENSSSGSTVFLMLSTPSIPLHSFIIFFCCSSRVNPLFPLSREYPSWLPFSLFTLIHNLPFPPTWLVNERCFFTTSLTLSTTLGCSNCSHAFLLLKSRAGREEKMKRSDRGNVLTRSGRVREGEGNGSL